MEEVMVDAAIVEEHSDVVGYAVEGTCCQPVIEEGDVVLVSRSASLKVGKFIVVRKLFDTMPRIGAFDGLEDGWKVHVRPVNGQRWRCAIDDVRGVVVAVVRDGRSISM